jgi:hypothetical protein
MKQTPNSQSQKETSLDGLNAALVEILSNAPKKGMSNQQIYDALRNRRDLGVLLPKSTAVLGKYLNVMMPTYRQQGVNVASYHSNSGRVWKPVQKGIWTR